jgi:hypothetical protein
LPCMTVFPTFSYHVLDKRGNDLLLIAVWIITVGNRPFAEQKQQMADQLYSGRTF